jgi:hypothetical protein
LDDVPAVVDALGPRVFGGETVVDVDAEGAQVSGEHAAVEVFVG